jgi:tetratricopeptide (TPR) repeat protein
MTGRQDHALTDAKSALELSNRVPNQALELANSALKFAGEGDWETQAFAYAALGSCYASLGRHEEAIRHVNEAQKIAFELRLTYVLARIHQARGWVAYTQDNSVLAFSDWQIAFDYFQQIRDMRGTAWIMMHYAANYASLGLIDLCIRCQVSALEIVNAQVDSDTLVELKVGLAQSYVAKAWDRSFVGDKGLSVVDAQIATAIILDILTERLDALSPAVVEKAFHTLGESLLIQEKPEEALPNLKLALTSSTHNGHYSSEARVQGATGYAYYLCNDHDSARQFLSQAIQSAPAATSLSDLALIHLWQAQVLESCGSHNESLASLRHAIQYDKRVHYSRLERWSKIHDLTLGISASLVSAESVAFQENEWIYTKQELDSHQSLVNDYMKGDPLTGVHNKAEALGLVKDLSFQFAAIFEIQNLEYINRKFERSVGDEVLRNVASVLVANLPPSAIVGRYSGNEFFVACDEDRLDALMMAFNKFPWLAIDPELSVRIAYRRVLPGKPHLLAA